MFVSFKSLTINITNGKKLYEYHIHFLRIPEITWKTHEWINWAGFWKQICSRLCFICITYVWLGGESVLKINFISLAHCGFSGLCTCLKCYWLILKTCDNVIISYSLGKSTATHIFNQYWLSYISMAWRKTAVTPLLTHWNHYSIALSHRFDQFWGNDVTQSNYSKPLTHKVWDNVAAI